MCWLSGQSEHACNDMPDRRDQHMLLGLPRNRPQTLVPQLGSFGVSLNVDHQVQASFSGLGFKFIRDGDGWLTVRGQKWRIVSPCLFVHEANEPAAYAPDTTWTEVYCVYPQSEWGHLRAAGVWQLEPPVWLMPREVEWTGMIEGLLALLQVSPTPEICSLYDQISWQAIQSAARSKLSQQPYGQNANPVDPLLVVKERLFNQDGRDVDFAQLADECGMSLQHFRRRWKQLFQLSPDQWLRQKRLLHARGLLSSTHKTIDAIAHEVGYDDRRYFARIFRRHFDMTPTEYRAKHHITAV